MSSSVLPLVFTLFVSHRKMLLSHSLALTFIALATSIPVYASAILPRQAPNTRQYIVFNKCPTSINLYIAGVLDSAIAAGGNVTKFLSTGAGFFYTDANGGASDATGTLRAGFLGDVSSLCTWIAQKRMLTYLFRISTTWCKIPTISTLVSLLNHETVPPCVDASFDKFYPF